MSEKTEKHCQRCGKQLSPDVLDGLCPACLMTVGDSATTAGMGKSFEPPTPEEVGRLFPALEIMELLGRGGMGAVYKARQPKLDRYVALKLLTRVKDPKLSEAEFAARFQQEARALARLAHPDIVAVHDFGEAGGYHYLLMEYVDGVTLRQLLRTQKLSPEQALRIVPKICEALQFAHERGIVHRDIKPENILLDKEGRVKIADFGIAKIVEAETGGAALTGAKDVIGTPHYMAPEQVEKPQTVDHRADIYSLGVVFYEMLTGELPLGKFQPPSKKVQVDVRLDEVVLHTLEKEPERRYQNVSEVKSDLETIATTSGSSRREEAQTDGLATRQSLVASAATSQDSRFSRTAIVGACWAPLFLFVAFAFMSVRVVQAGEYHGPEWWQYLLMFTLLPLGLAAPFGTTILGWVAVSQIRRSAGKLYGMWLAVCDGLFFPLLALGGVIFGLLYWIFVEELHWKLSLVVLLTLIIAVSLGVFLVRRVWRAVNARSSEPKSAAFAQSAIGNRQSVGSGWGWMGTAVGLHAVLLMAVVAFFVFAVPRFVEQSSSLAVALPTGTLLTIKFAQFIRTGGFHLVPLLLALDVAICWLVQRFAGRRLLGAWFAMVSLGLTALVLGSVWLLNLPFQELLTTERERNERMLEVLQFGPEKEVTLTEFNNMDGQEALDLDTGTVFKQPKDMDQWSETGFGQWVRENGVDLFVDHGPGGLWGLMTTTDAGLKLARLENDKWSAIRAAELAQVLAGGPKALQIVKQGIMKVYLPPKEARPPMTCAFKTGNGGVGVLQITGYTGNPSGVKIRYKLAQGPTETTAINRSPFPKAAHVGENSRSVMRVDDDVDLYYAFFHAGNFDSDWRGSHNTKTKTWQDDGDLTLKNGRSFGYRRDSTDPDHLRVNGREFDLRAGRVLVLNDDGSIAQLARFPSLAVARDLSELARLVGAQGGNRAGRVATQRSENKFVSLYRAELGQKVLDAARDFVEEHGWKMLAESGGKEGNPERVVFLAVDRFSKAIEFEEVVPVEGKARFSISTEPGAELSAQRIGAAIWRRLGLAAVPDPATTTVFGPVMERMVADIDEARGKECLILETGALLDFPKAELKGLTKAEQEAWFVDRGVNLLMDTVNGRRGLGLRDMTVTLVPNEAWEREDRAEVEQAIALGKPGVEFKDRGGFRWHIMPTNAPLPLTFAFRMGSGRVGLLQVLDFKDDPGGVTLRCKLAAGAADQTKPTATNAVVAAPVTPNPQEAVTRARLRQLSSAIDTFEVDCGAYPGSLDVLVRNPGGLDWKGPYFPANSWPPKDAWGTPFQIEVGDQPRNRKPSILSAGPDKQFGTADDLVEKVINPATFGPVMESVLKAPQVGPEGRVAELLDLDTGRRGSSANFGDNDRETHAWLRTNQLDVLGVIEHGQIAVLCFDMTVMPAVSNDWETVTAQNVVTNWNLAQSEPNKITGISPMTDNTDTWLFRTREGGHGILQILGQSSDPLGVKIRYKLVQTADSVAVSQPSPAPARRMIAQAPFSAKLEEGEVELAALSYYPSANEPWWAPDGGAAKGGPFVTEASGDSSADFRMFALVARLRNVPADASQPVWKLEPRNSWAEGKVLPPDEKADGKLVMISCKQPRSAVTANVKIGIASGDWETVARARAAAVNPGVQPGPKGSATFVPLADSEAGLRVTVTHNYKDTEIRLMAIDSDGSSRDGKDLEQVLSEKIGHTTMTFPGLSLKQAAQQRVEFHFQVRPYHWVEFHNVSLKPGRWTQVEVQDALRN